jgi:hypothetical protein
MLATWLVLLALGQNEAPRIDSFLKAMKKSEQAFNDREMTYRFEVVSVHNDGKRPANTTILSIRDYRLTTQGPLYKGIFREQHFFGDKTSKDLSSEVGYDGRLTRTNYQNAVGNKEEARVTTSSWLTPHRVAFPELPLDFTMADWIGHTPPVSTHPAFRSMRVTSKVLGTEQIDQVECVKLESTWTREGADVPRSRYVYWIAPSRGYLPLRVVTYDLPSSDKIPHVDARVSDLREIAPGCWVPYRMSFIQNRLDELSKGRESLGSRGELRISDIKLNPNYPPEYFSDVALPLHVPIHTIKGGEILNTEVI